MFETDMKEFSHVQGAFLIKCSTRCNNSGQASDAKNTFGNFPQGIHGCRITKNDFEVKRSRHEMERSFGVRSTIIVISDPYE